MTFLSDAVLLAGVALRAEWRSRRALVAAVTLGGVALVLAGLAAGPGLERLRGLAPALTWIALLYAALAVAERLDRVDRVDDAFSALWLVLEDRRSLLFARIVALSVVLLGLQVALWALAIVLLDVAIGPWLVGLVPLAAASAVALAAVASIAVALAGASTQQTLLFPVVLLPLSVPTLLGGVQATDALIAADLARALGWTVVLLVQAALFSGVGLLTYDAIASPG